MAAPLAVPLPTTYLETAEFDCLHDEGLAYAARLRQHGTPVEVYETQDTLHGYDFCLEAPQTASSVQRWLAFLRRVLFPEA